MVHTLGLCFRICSFDQAKQAWLVAVKEFGMENLEETCARWPEIAVSTAIEEAKRAVGGKPVILRVSWTSNMCH